MTWFLRILTMIAFGVLLYVLAGSSMNLFTQLVAQWQ